MSLGDELSSLNFESLIGGPLNAGVKAQAQSAMTSVDFIKAVGFDHDQSTGDITGPTMITFSYKKTVDEKQTDGSTKPVEKQFNLTVPFLTMLPIPFIRVEETTIDFNAKITSIIESSAATQFGIDTEMSAKGGCLFASASLKVNCSYKRSTTSSAKVERTYSMSVHVRAVQDELPAGTERLLSILENSIKETPASA